MHRCGSRHSAEQPGCESGGLTLQHSLIGRAVLSRIRRQMVVVDALLFIIQPSCPTRSRQSSDWRVVPRARPRCCC
jgi:hypothetical protein